MTNIIISDDGYKHDGGPVLLLAGPGTGKTWQLAKRIQYLTNEKEVHADEITVITFTAPAAKGMKVKLKTKGTDEYIEPEKRPERIMTMHALGHSILIDNFDSVGLKKDFIVVGDDLTKKTLMRDAAMLLGFNEADAKKAFTSRTKADSKQSDTSRKIIAKYEEILRASNAVDYDDQITLACALLKQDKSLRQKYTKHSKYLLVDEYQDINEAQFEFINILSQDNRKGLFAVGDDDQSIYGFRGGDPSFIRNFRKNFGEDSIIIQMRTSRRCPKNILECANCVVSNFDSSRVAKKDYLYTEKDSGMVVLHDCPSDDREAEIIAAIVSSGMREASDNGERKEYFILIPNKNYSQKIQNTLKKFGIPFDSSFGDKDSGLSTFKLIEEWIENKNSNFTLRSCIEMLLESGTLGLPTSKARTIANLEQRERGLREVASLWEEVITEKKSLVDVLLSKTSSSKFLDSIASRLQELADLYEADNLPEFLNKTSLYTKPWSSVKNFLKDVKTLTRSRSVPSSSEHRIVVSTLQSSKGLQADVVFIIGLEEEIMPRKNTKNIEEEARLLFVGMTRSKQELHLFKSRRRTSASTYRPIPHKLEPSRFLEHLEDGMYKKQFHKPKGN